MARILTESFEGTGYETTSPAWSESTSAIAVNEDSAIPGTPPPNSGTQCLYSSTNAADGHATATIDTGATRATSYTRAYVYFDSWTMASGNEFLFLQLKSGGANTFVLGLYHNGTAVVFRAMYHTGDPYQWNALASTTAVEQDRWYCVELGKTAAGALELRVDNATIASASGKTLDRGEPREWAIGGQGNGGYATMYIDLVAVDDATWVGPEVAAGGSIVPKAMHAYRQFRS